MQLKAVLFDLDGTLLPMDQDAFTRRYFKLLAQKLAPHGYDPKQLIDGIWAGMAAMTNNNGTCSNEDAFWACFAGILGEHTRNDLPIFDAFYRNEFIGAKEACGFSPKANEVVALVKRKGLRAILATNPLFPSVATENRIGWAGLNIGDFDFFTTYENSSHCKPNPDYYRDILDRAGLSAEECLMVGNDAHEDMIAATLGMQVFLLTDCLINKDGIDISVYPNGDFDALMQFIEDITA